MADTQSPNIERVTLAVLQTELRHCMAKLDEYHADVLRAVTEHKSDCRQRHADHETRLRDLERSSRTGTVADVGAYLAAIAAGVAGALVGKP